MKDRHVNVLPIPLAPVRYIVWNDNQDEIAGYCFITANIKREKSILHDKEIKEALIWHIYTDPRYRRQGYAKVLIDALKVHYDIIISEALVSESRKLLLKCGFCSEEFGDNKLKVFVWKKQK